MTITAKQRLKNLKAEEKSLRDISAHIQKKLTAIQALDKPETEAEREVRLKTYTQASDMFDRKQKTYEEVELERELRKTQRKLLEIERDKRSMGESIMVQRIPEAVERYVERANALIESYVELTALKAYSRTGYFGGINDLRIPLSQESGFRELEGLNTRLHNEINVMKGKLASEVKEINESLEDDI